MATSSHSKTTSGGKTPPPKVTAGRKKHLKRIRKVRRRF